MNQTILFAGETVETEHADTGYVGESPVSDRLKCLLVQRDKPHGSREWGNADCGRNRTIRV